MSAVLTAGVKQDLPVLAYSKRDQFHYLHCTHHRALCCMKWSKLYLYQYKNKVITNRGGDIQNDFSLLCDIISLAIQTFFRQSHSFRKKIQPTVSQESHQYLSALVFFSCMKEMQLFSQVTSTSCYLGANMQGCQQSPWSCLSTTKSRVQSALPEVLKISFNVLRYVPAQELFSNALSMEFL